MNSAIRGIKRQLEYNNRWIKIYQEEELPKTKERITLLEEDISRLIKEIAELEEALKVLEKK